MSDSLLTHDDPVGDARLHALFRAEETAPTRDPDFVHAAMQRVAVRRFWFNLLAAVPWLIAASAALWAFTPVLGDLWRDVARTWDADAPMIRGLAHLIVLITPAAAAILGLLFLAPAHERRL